MRANLHLKGVPAVIDVGGKQCQTRSATWHRHRRRRLADGFPLPLLDPHPARARHAVVTFRWIIGSVVATVLFAAVFLVLQNSGAFTTKQIYYLFLVLVVALFGLLLLALLGAILVIPRPALALAARNAGIWIAIGVICVIAFRYREFFAEIYNQLH